MQITPKSAPNVANSNQPASDASSSARARAIAILTTGGPASGNEVVQNQNNVSPEEMGAVKTASTETKDTEKTEQKTIDKSTSESEASKDKEEPLSSQYAQLARREKALRAERMQFKAKEEAFKAREEAIKAKELEYQTNYIPKSSLKEDALSVLSDAGVDNNDLIERLLNQPKSEDTLVTKEIRALREEIKALKGEQENTKKSFQDTQQATYDQAIAQIDRDVRSLVKNNENFETITAMKQEREVVKLIETTFNEGLGDEYPAGTVLSTEEAAQIVEDYLVEEAMKIAKISKIAKKLQPVSVTTEKKLDAGESQQTKQQTKTLTNAQGTNRPLSARERAMLAFKGEKF